MKINKLILTALCLVLVLGMMVSPTLAYFTDSHDAEGSIEIQLGYKTTIEEKVDENQKILTIFNEGPEACYVRARAYAGGDLDLSYEGSGWTKDGDWYVYDSILEGGQSTAPLTVTITFPDGIEGDQQNVVVIYESAKVIYDEDGNPMPADWTMEANIED